ncbi:spore photoproduct lyase family protein [Tautonia rosea]|uniref:spore photoproduct lyase family protein n=1 Tax=Tautonia rosea TaxID=2728037 RepID=UPI001475FDDC|nr:spore photoproduct lyase family protein [Tautonia rosea]
MPTRSAPVVSTAMLDVGTIYLEASVPDIPRGREILDRFPKAERVVVPSHWNIPGLHGNEGNAEDWLRIKKSTLVLGLRKGMEMRPNGRSADFIAPGFSNGCAMACAYCYVPRRKGYANPISTFVNIDAICQAIERHAARQGNKGTPNQVDPWQWVYDIGENGDCSVDALISDNLRDLVALFRRLPNAKASFATKFVNRALLDYDPCGKTRIRFSMMPPIVAKLLDIRTSSIADRIAAIDDFVAAGYEVHLNFSPVVYYEGWLDDYAELFSNIDDAIGPRARRQLRAEVIFLTHHDGLHEVNLRWHPKAEDLLWVPELQEEKTSETGGRNVRYRRGLKTELVDQFVTLLRKKLPYCGVRYAF